MTGYFICLDNFIKIKYNKHKVIIRKNVLYVKKELLDKTILTVGIYKSTHKLLLELKEETGIPFVKLIHLAVKKYKESGEK